jgi:hypothetical protein
MPLKWISSDQLEDGMVLGLSVLDERGRELLPAGTSLQASMAERFAAWAIDELAIAIEDDGLPVPPVIRARAPAGLSDSQVIKHTELRLRRRFMPFAGDPLMEMIERVARRKLVRTRTGALRGSAWRR